MVAGYARVSEDGDAELLGPRLREIDIDEIETVSGHRDGVYALSSAHSAPDTAFTIVRSDGLLLGMFGVTTITHGLGMVWLLAAPELEANPSAREFLKQSRFWVALMSKQCPVMFNIVDARNTTTINWLKWCGFRFPYPPRPFGTKQRPSIYFEKVPANV